MNKAAQQFGRLGGKTKSAAKSAAAKANGRLGGRPKKQKIVEPWIYPDSDVRDAIKEAGLEKSKAAKKYLRKAKI